jgi:hypothetical protein
MRGVVSSVVVGSGVTGLLLSGSALQAYEYDPLLDSIATSFRHEVEIGVDVQMMDDNDSTTYTDAVARYNYYLEDIVFDDAPYRESVFASQRLGHFSLWGGYQTVTEDSADEGAKFGAEIEFATPKMPFFFGLSAQGAYFDKTVGSTETETDVITVRGFIDAYLKPRVLLTAGFTAVMSDASAVTTASDGAKSTVESDATDTAMDARLKWMSTPVKGKAFAAAIGAKQYMPDVGEDVTTATGSIDYYFSQKFGLGVDGNYAMSDTEEAEGFGGLARLSYYFQPDAGVLIEGGMFMASESAGDHTDVNATLQWRF